jgi:hypothetical protein
MQQKDGRKNGNLYYLQTKVGCALRRFTLDMYGGIMESSFRVTIL